MLLAPKIMIWTVNICFQARFCFSKKNFFFLGYTVYRIWCNSLSSEVFNWDFNTWYKIIFHLPIGYDNAVVQKYIHVYYTHTHTYFIIKQCHL